MKISYETHYESKKPDGRYNSSMAAHMAWLRGFKPKLTMPENLTYDEFLIWQKNVKAKAEKLLCMPKFTQQPEPKLLSRVKRDTYTVEKWEFYPDDYSAVPFLILIPDGVTNKNPAPGVLCFPGSVLSNVDISDHFFRKEPSLRFLKKIFKLE